MPEAIENARHRLPPTYASHTYKVLGKVDLSDSVWLEVKENISRYRFFKVTVEEK